MNTKDCKLITNAIKQAKAQVSNERSKKLLLWAIDVVIDEIDEALDCAPHVKQKVWEQFIKETE